MRITESEIRRLTRKILSESTATDGTVALALTIMFEISKRVREMVLEAGASLTARGQASLYEPEEDSRMEKLELVEREVNLNSDPKIQSLVRSLVMVLSKIEELKASNRDIQSDIAGSVFGLLWSWMMAEDYVSTKNLLGDLAALQIAHNKLEYFFMQTDEAEYDIKDLDDSLFRAYEKMKQRFSESGEAL